MGDQELYGIRMGGKTSLELSSTDQEVEHSQVQIRVL